MGHTEHLLNTFPLHPATAFDPTYFLSCSVSNVICSLVFGQRFSYDDDHFLYLLQTISETLRFFSSPWGQVTARSAVGGLMVQKCIAQLEV